MLFLAKTGRTRNSRDLPHSNCWQFKFQTILNSQYNPGSVTDTDIPRYFKIPKWSRYTIPTIEKYRIPKKKYRKTKNRYFHFVITVTALLVIRVCSQRSQTESLPWSTSSVISPQSRYDYSIIAAIICPALSWLKFFHSSLLWRNFTFLSPWFLC